MSQQPENVSQNCAAILVRGAAGVGPNRSGELDPALADMIRAIARFNAQQDHAKVTGPRENQGRPIDENEEQPVGGRLRARIITGHRTIN